MLSRPPGLPDCDPATPCGVPGVVAGAQTYDNSKSLLSALTDGKVATAVIPALPLMRARCDVAKGQAGPPVSILKILYRHPLYLLVHGGSPPILKPGDWAGKTIVVGPAGSDSETIALALMDAYRLPKTKVKLQRLPPPAAFAALRDGTAAAGIFMGHVFDVPIGDFLSRGFTLMSLPDSPERKRLLQALPALEAGAIPPGTYPGLPAISTVTQPVVWAAGPGLDATLQERLIAAISEVHNQARIADLVDPVLPVPDGEAFLRLPATPSEGAKQFAASKNLPVEIIGCPASTAQATSQAADSSEPRLKSAR
ncbi:MAG: transporter solute receptor, family protein [Rhodospirillales bacterium]|nr:transporter solute receptor, family protein [Rhodospirillales bacterium]